MEIVYIETSVVSYLVAQPPRGTLAHQWHVWTQDWWRLRRPLFECVMSAEVLREAAEGGPEMSRRRLAALGTLTVLRRFLRGWTNFQTVYRPLADAWAVDENSGDAPPSARTASCKLAPVPQRAPHPLPDQTRAATTTDLEGIVSFGGSPPG